MLIIPREICRNLEHGLSREWLVTNGLGGYASSSICGANTRRYHGILVAALVPPSARTVLLAKLDEEVQVNDSTYRLATNEYESGTIQPDGYLFLERVEQHGMIPTFYYKAATFSLTKTIWMEHGQNTTYIQYRLDGESKPVRLTLLPLCTYRDAHLETRGALDWRFRVQTEEGNVEITAKPDAVPFRLLTVPAAEYVSLDLWYWRFKHRMEEERGLDFVEDLYMPGLVRRALSPGETLTFIVTTEPAEAVDRDGAAALARARARQDSMSDETRDDVERQLILAADQFIVRKQVDERVLKSVIAGYHWFSDWGRDTMISLEGLTLTTGRFQEARDILVAFSQYVDEGMLPNRFPDIGPDGTPAPVEYNTVDATLWYFHALDRYLSASGDATLLHDLYPILASIIEWHLKGTRYGIRVDRADGLLRAGQPGVQLTWMDAIADDWVVTPRIGKPVEINALWYRALCLMEGWASTESPATAAPYADLAARVRESFERFWFRDGGYLYDVIDGPAGNDASLRPNQLFALSLTDDLVPREQARSVLAVVERELLTPVGLRSLSPRDPKFRAGYRGNQRERDASYHQGVIWPWLIGAYVDACARVNGACGSAHDILDNLHEQFTLAGIGTLSEIHEGQPAYRPVGCIAQAWSVAEVLRVYKRL